MAKLKLITRIEDVERATDVHRMTPAELEFHAARCPDEIRQRLTTLSDTKLKKILAGGYDEL
jgi:hypothetical protein